MLVPVLFTIDRCKFTELIADSRYAPGIVGNLEVIRPLENGIIHLEHLWSELTVNVGLQCLKLKPSLKNVFIS